MASIGLLRLAGSLAQLDLAGAPKRPFGVPSDADNSSSDEEDIDEDTIQYRERMKRYNQAARVSAQVPDPAWESDDDMPLVERKAQLDAARIAAVPPAALAPAAPAPAALAPVPDARRACAVLIVFYENTKPKRRVESLVSYSIPECPGVKRLDQVILVRLVEGWFNNFRANMPRSLQNRPVEIMAAQLPLGKPRGPDTFSRGGQSLGHFRYTQQDADLGPQNVTVFRPAYQGGWQEVSFAISALAAWRSRVFKQLGREISFLDSGPGNQVNPIIVYTVNFGWFANYIMGQYTKYLKDDWTKTQVQFIKEDNADYLLRLTSTSERAVYWSGPEAGHEFSVAGAMSVALVARRNLPFPY